MPLQWKHRFLTTGLPGKSNLLPLRCTTGDPALPLLSTCCQQLPHTFFRLWEYSVAIVMSLACACGLSGEGSSAKIEVNGTIVVILVTPCLESPSSDHSLGPGILGLEWSHFSSFLTTRLYPDTPKKETGWLLKSLTTEKVSISLEQKRAQQKHDCEGL